MPTTLTRTVEGVSIGHTFFTREMVESAAAYGLIRILEGFEWEVLSIPADLPDAPHYYVVNGMVLTQEQVTVTVSEVKPCQSS